jgi:hypothetical protein
VTANVQLRREVLHRVAGTITGGSKVANSFQVVDWNGSSAYMTNQPRHCCAFEAWVPYGDYELESQFITGNEGEFEGSMPIHVDGENVTGLVFPLMHAPAPKLPIEISSIANTNAPRELCMQTRAACGFWYLQAMALQPTGYLDGGAQSTPWQGADVDATTLGEFIQLKPGSYPVDIDDF